MVIVVFNVLTNTIINWYFGYFLKFSCRQSPAVSIKNKALKNRPFCAGQSLQFQNRTKQNNMILNNFTLCGT